jgi:hypothetical protein
VIAADRMVTLGNFIEFEHTVPKMAPASPFAIALVAGDSLIGTRIAQDVADAVASSNPPVVDVARTLATEYDTARQAAIEEQILRPRGLNIGTYYSNHNSLNGQVMAMLDNQMAQLNLGS